MANKDNAEILARAWGILGHYIDLKNMEKTEYAVVKRSAAVLADISKNMDVETPQQAQLPKPKEVLMDNMLEELTSRKTQLGKKICPEQ